MRKLLNINRVLKQGEVPKGDPAMPGGYDGSLKMASRYAEEKEKDTSGNQRRVTEGLEAGYGVLQGGPGNNALPPASGEAVQKFDTGATRSADVGKLDYEGFMSFPAIEEFGEYMNRHRIQPDGSVRDSDNWQRGIPISSYVKSLVRHALELWGLHRGHVSARLRREYPLADIVFLKRETACACWFNVQGFLHETLRQDRQFSQFKQLVGGVQGAQQGQGLGPGIGAVGALLGGVYNKVA